MNTKVKKFSCYAVLVLIYTGLSQLGDGRLPPPMVSQCAMGDQLQLEIKKSTVSRPADGNALGSYSTSTHIKGNTDPRFAVRSRELKSQLNDPRNED